MKLQILVPQYKEDEEVIRNLLHSIAIQQDVDRGDFEVIICNDGSDVKLSDTFLSSFPFKITYLFNGFIKHGGVSKTRNRLLSYSTADYIMCCDADDMFVSAFGLKRIFEAIENNDFDILVSAFIGQSIPHTDGKRHYITVQRDKEFVHAKVFRRQFLIDNNIRWKDELIFSGDTYFLLLAFYSAEDIEYIEDPFYLWVWNKNSICRHEANHMWKTFYMRLIGDEYLIDELILRGDNKHAVQRFVETLYDFYENVTINKENDDVKQRNYREFLVFLTKYAYFLETDLGKKEFRKRDTRAIMRWLETVVNKLMEEKENEGIQDI